MLKLRRRVKSGGEPAQPPNAQPTLATPPITFEFVATFDAAASAAHRVGEDSGVYTMCQEDSFAVLRDQNKVTAAAAAQASAPVASNAMPKVIAVMLEPDGQSRFFHPEASRRAGRPIWQPLQPVES